MVEPTSHSDATRLNASPSLGVFVGRQREMAGLRTVLDDAISGQGRLVMLTGEPCIGKTNVAQELAGAAESQGMRVFWGRCYEGLGAPPFWPWVRWTQSATPLWDANQDLQDSTNSDRHASLQGLQDSAAVLLGRGSSRSRICSLRAFKDATAA